MAHAHNVVDADPHYRIDPVTRQITLADDASEKVIMQFDHNSERLSFELPRYIDGHDMSTCNKVEVHYNNAADNNVEKAGVYEVEDLAISEDDEDIVVCTWLISQNATSYAGTLSFSLCYSCVTDGVVDYSWSTAEYTGKTIKARRNNGNAVVKQIPDVLDQYMADIIAALIDRYPTDAGLLPEVDADMENYTLSVFDGEWTPYPVENLSSEYLETDNKTIIEAINELRRLIIELANNIEGGDDIITA